MADVNLYQSDFIGFSLKSDTSPSLELSIEPIGWRDDELEVVRNKNYHGVFTQFTNALSFVGEAKDYIYYNYEVGGVNANLYLTKYELENIDGVIKPQLKYIGLADYKTMKIKDGKLSINFNSNQLEELIKSHETDEFELERSDSIDGKDIGVGFFNTMTIDGRDIIASGESIVRNPNTLYTNDRRITIPTEIVAQGPARHSSVDLYEFPGEDGAVGGDLPTYMFFVDSVAAGENVDIEVNYHIVFRKFNIGDVDVIIRKYKYDGVDTYNLVDETTVYTATSSNVVNEFSGVFEDNLEYDEGLVFLFRNQAATNLFIDCEKHTLQVNTVEFFEPSVGVRCSFVVRALERLMQIITGRNNAFYSKLFGNLEAGYVQDGEFGLVALTCGFWIRMFNPNSEKYKSMQLSLKKTLESLHAVFCTGVGVEFVGFEQRLRVEKLSYFYQDETVVRLPIPVNTEVKVEKNLLYSGIEIGYNKGGDYENEIGLDEPNTKTSFVTPIRKSNEKYNKLSDIRADEYGLEIIRRKPQSAYPNEDTSGDSHNWFVDLKRTSGIRYAQKIWSDRLQHLPSGILSPGTFKSMLFTPLRMLLRHGFVLRSCLENSIDLTKKIKNIGSVANSTLGMHFIGESAELLEEQDVDVNSLERARFLPEIVSFQHPVDSSLMKEILNTTPKLINGSWEKVPNTYFKMEWTNAETGEIERGYLMSLKPKNSGKFEFIRANEKIINI